MIDLSTAKYHDAIEEIVDTLCLKTQNEDRGFFRIVAAFFLSKMAASMRAKIMTKDRGEIPVNTYAINLAESGFGKGYSVNIVEKEFLGGFRKRFMDDTFPLIADEHLWKEALNRAASNCTSEEKEKEGLDKEFNLAGELAFTFDSATPAAVKQLRHKLLLANCGAINLQIDEIGSNLMASTDVLNTFLELYDQGLIKQKLTKNTAENVRAREIDGKTPTNAMLFGTPANLLNGAQTEDAFFTFLETGYARRCLFGWGEPKPTSDNLSPAELYQKLTSPQNQTNVNQWAQHFTLLADPAKYNWTMDVSDPVGIELLTYKIECERVANQFPQGMEIQKAEMKHRYFKALKLAGALAFVDESMDITMDHLHSAILLVEDSGKAFKKLMDREKPYEKLAKYIASREEDDITHADLHDALPFYKSSPAARNDMMSLAMSWGYKNNIIIRKTFADGIEFFSGETLKETNLDEILVSYSDHFAYDYEPVLAPFDNLAELVVMPDMNWCNHQFHDQHRMDEKVIPGFNMAVVDVDGDVSLESAHELLKEYKFMTYTTKRHSDDEHRFRLMFPINYHLELDTEDYREFANNLMEWLPFGISDKGGNQRAKKWLTNEHAKVHINDGKVLDALKFIPKTSRNEEYRHQMNQLQSLDNLERWFAQRFAQGDRNNQMIKFALALVDDGMTFSEVERRVLDFNEKLADGLSENEIRKTILVSVAKKMQKAA